jgi:valyl-tRNA synthetase
LPCAPVEPQPAGKELDEQKERFLREFKAKLYAAHMQINSTSHRCTYAGEDDAGHDSAAVCKVCYERLQGRMDLLESALEMDLKEAAQIIYDAVWADTSDSTRTYMNAARALLGKLRKRAGMTTGVGGMQPLAR